MKKFIISLLLVLFLATPCLSQTMSSKVYVYQASDCSFLTWYGALCQDTDDGKVYKWNGATQVELAAGGATSPGGATTNVQFNNTGAFDGDGEFTWNTTSKILTITTGGITLSAGASLGSTGTRVTKGWFTNLEITGYPTVNGVAVFDQDVSADGNPSFSTINVVGTNSLNLGTASSLTGQLVFKTAGSANAFTLQPGATGAALSWTLPIAAPGGADYLLNVDADGTMGYTNPATLGGGSTAINDIGDAAGDGTIAQTGYKQIWTSTLNTAGSVWTMTNTTADLTADVSFIDFIYTDDGDANGFFMRGYDNLTNLKWSIGLDGQASFGSLTGTAISDSTSTTSSTVAASATAVKAAYDRVSTTITVADTTDATTQVALFEDPTGDLGPKTDLGLTYNASSAVLMIGINDTNNGEIYLYGDNADAGAKITMFNSVNEDDVESYWQLESNGTQFLLGLSGDTDLFIFTNAGNFTTIGNIAGATYGSDATVSNAELLFINTLSSNAQDQLNAKSPTAGSSSLVTTGALTTGSLATGFTPVTVPLGGTGASTYALNGVLYGNAANAIGVTAIGAEGKILRVGANPFVPDWSSYIIALPTTSGQLLKADGTNWTATSSITGVAIGGLTASRAVYGNASGILESHATLTDTELGYLDGVTAPTGTGALVLGTSPVFTTSILPSAAGATVIGTTALPFSSIFIGDAATNNVQLINTAAASAVVLTLPSTSGTLARLEDKISDLAAVTSAELYGKVSDETGSASGTPLLVFNQNPTLVAPVLGAATATSLLATGIVDGTAPVVITATSAGYTLGATYKSGYTFTNPVAAAATFNFTLPTPAAAGLQYCVGNGAAKTGILKVNAGTDNLIDLDGTLGSASGYAQATAVAGNFACFIGVDSTHWKAIPTKGTWTIAGP